MSTRLAEGLFHLFLQDQIFIIMKKAFVILCTFFVIGQGPAQPDLIQYVNPFIGTKKMGHTFPGACVPFGMVQLSPDTDTIGYWDEDQYNKKVYEYCAGYQFDDPTIVGFSHTHFSGTGHSDLGDFLVMPTLGPLQLNPGTADHPGTGFRSTYSKETEKAAPGWYHVTLDEGNITADLTATERVGFHQYSFPETEEAHIILDLVHGLYNYEDKNVWTFVRVENDTLVTGYRQTSGWARTRTVYFAMVFSKPFKTYGHKKYDEVTYRGFYRKFNEEENFPEMAGRKLRCHFDFDIEEHERLNVKFALSAVSTEGALGNLQAEVPHWNFDRTRKEAREKWNAELSKIRVETTHPMRRLLLHFSLSFLYQPRSLRGCRRALPGAGPEYPFIRPFYQLYHLFSLGYLPCAAPTVQPGAAATQRQHGKFDAGPF